MNFPVITQSRMTMENYIMSCIELYQFCQPAHLIYRNNSTRRLIRTRTLAIFSRNCIAFSYFDPHMVSIKDTRFSKSSSITKRTNST